MSDDRSKSCSNFQVLPRRACHSIVSSNPDLSDRQQNHLKIVSPCTGKVKVTMPVG